MTMLTRKEILHNLIRGMDGHKTYGVPLPVWDIIRALLVSEYPDKEALNFIAEKVKKHNHAVEANSEVIYYDIEVDVEKLLDELDG
jgi:hypothetical protein